jgi:hypothetical protein
VTVAELIAELQLFDPNIPVYRCDYEFGESLIHHLGTRTDPYDWDTLSLFLD